MNAMKSLYRYMNKISEFCSKCIEFITAMLLALCTIDLLYQVIYRFIIVKFTTISSPFTEEFARYSMIWCVYLAICICYKEGNMPSLNLVYDRVKGKNKLILYFINRAIILFFLFYGLKYGYLAILNNANYVSPVMQLSGIFIYSSPLVACGLLLYEFITEMVGVISSEVEPFSGRLEKNTILTKLQQSEK